MECLTKLYTRLMLSRFMLSLKSEKGQGLVEYALIIVVIALTVLIALKYLSTQINTTYCSAGSTLVKP